MKNIHILPTDKPSRLHFDGNLFLSPNYQDSKTINSIVEGKHIYITSDEEIKVGDWYLDTIADTLFKSDKIFLNGVGYKKIILTTDPSLAPDIQKIDDEFLEWFVKNPSCEEVELGLEHYFDKNIDKSPFFPLRYKIIIPTEEPKQQRMYSEEEVLKLLISCKERFGGSDLYDYVDDSKVIKWFEQIKKK